MKFKWSCFVASWDRTSSLSQLSWSRFWYCLVLFITRLAFSFVEIILLLSRQLCDRVSVYIADELTWMTRRVAVAELWIQRPRRFESGSRSSRFITRFFGVSRSRRMKRRASRVLMMSFGLISIASPLGTMCLFNCVCFLLETWLFLLLFA